ncbi:winged helix-turn-helix domain-containing protein [Streptomyces aureus]|uniref:helix-turn-helix domain-containing protein n=1 Tax=Streptomyces aureus TaxID=193461 RepID=UPI00369C7F29
MQIARLERELERGLLVHGWADQLWTPARVTTLIGRLFHVSYTIEGTWRLLKRHSCSKQQPARRAIERDDAVVELWRKAVWPRVKAPRRLAGPGRLREQVGQSMTPPRAKTWGRIGHAPVVVCADRDQAGFRWRGWPDTGWAGSLG